MGSQRKAGPMIDGRTPELRACGIGQTPGQLRAVTLVTLFLQMTAGVGVLLLLFIAQAGITLWNSCAWATQTKFVEGPPAKIPPIGIS